MLRTAIVVVLACASAHAQPLDGPPSEALANALRLYQQERYAEAAPRFEDVSAGRSPDAPANRQKAEFFLAKCLFHLHRYPEALTAFGRVIDRGRAHLYFQASLYWLDELWAQLPETPAILDRMARYEQSDIDMLDTPAGHDRCASLLYLLGRARFAEHRYAEARALFERVPAGTPVSAQAQEWAARARAIAGPQ